MLLSQIKVFSFKSQIIIMIIIVIFTNWKLGNFDFMIHFVSNLNREKYIFNVSV